MPGLDERVDVVDPLGLDAVLHVAVGVLGVVRLVEDQRARDPEPVEPQVTAERGNEQRTDPAPHPVRGERSDQPLDATELAAEPGAVKHVVAQHEGHRRPGDEIGTDRERLGQPFRLRLHGVVNRHPQV